MNGTTSDKLPNGHADDVNLDTSSVPLGDKTTLHPAPVEGTQLTALDGMDTAAGASADDWSANVSEEEDYDALQPEPGTVRMSQKERSDENARPGFIRGDTEIGPDGRSYVPIRTQADAKDGHDRRKSVQIMLEKGAKGRYVLTGDDPEIREILRLGLEREAAAAEPSKKKSRKLFRDMVFTRQFTTFDRQNTAGSQSPFFGFFTLFWIMMSGILMKVAAENWRDHGSVLGENQIMKMMFGRDVWLLGITDGVMCGSTLFGYYTQKYLVAKGYINWGTSGWVLQNIWQTFYIGAVVGWTFYRDWPWTHTVFTVLHGLVFLMKQHSYSFYNGYLSQVYRRRAMLQEKLKKLDALEPISSPPSSPVSKRASLPGTSSGISHSPSNSASGTSLHRRRSIGPKSNTNLNTEQSEISNIASAIESGKPLDADQMSTFNSVIQNEISALNEELQGKATDPKNSYPNNLTLGNFADWTCLPTLVYELEYPRQEKINWWYVFEKSAATFGVIWVMLVISQAYIYPPMARTFEMKEQGMSLEERWKEFPWVLSDMLVPLLLEQLLTWYVIWECVLNVLAEVTKFADRGFYGDWWNSVSWDQYARDWNRPVHNFLLRHVYHSSISAFRLSKTSATFMTFFLSACVHELVMFCLFKKVRGYLFTMQLLQMPLVSLSKTKWLKGRNVLGNVIFWVGLFVGPSALTSLYLIV